MTHPSRSVLRTVAIAGAIGAGVVAAVVVASVVVFLSRYVQKEDVGSDSAAREFEQVRSRFVSRLPVIEFRGFQDPTVRRTRLPPGTSWSRCMFLPTVLTMESLLALTSRQVFFGS
jgi:hypothetical protein